MKKIFFACVPCLVSVSLSAQGNIGIGTTTPSYPLSFSNTVGDKISLYGNTGPHYGFGIQSALLQVHTDAAAANIAFGYGSSGAFTERARITNSGTNGLSVNGRLLLRNGTSPIDLNQAAGVWLYTPDNSAQLAFIGVQNNQNVGFYGGPAGWGFTYNAVNSRVGIGNNNPNAPLSFPASLGKKITLYPGATGDVGIGVSGNRLYLYADNPNADVAFGWDAAGVFNERFAVKPSGALALSGNMGLDGQLLMSGGAGLASQWVTLGNLIQTITTEGGPSLNNTNVVTISSAQMNIVTTRPTKVMLFCQGSINLSCTVVGPCHGAWLLDILLDGTSVTTYTIQGTSQPGALTDYRMVGPVIMNLSPGIHTISFTAMRMVGQAATPVFTGLKATAIMFPG